MGGWTGIRGLLGRGKASTVEPPTAIDPRRSEDHETRAEEKEIAEAVTQPSPPIDDEALRLAVWRTIGYSPGGFTRTQLRKRLEQNASWDTWAANELAKLDNEERAERLEYEENLAILRQYAHDPRVEAHVKDRLRISQAESQVRSGTIKLLVELGSDWAVEMLRDIANNDPLCEEISTAPSYYTDPDVYERYPTETNWPLRNEAMRGLRQLGKE